MKNKKKLRCEKCNRLIRKCKLKKNKITSELMCSMCLRRYGENKYYVGRETGLMSKQNRYINNFNITDDEKKVLLKRKTMSQINFLCGRLRKVKREKRKEDRQKKIESKVDKKKRIETQKKFLRGLK